MAIPRSLNESVGLPPKPWWCLPSSFISRRQAELLGQGMGVPQARGKPFAARHDMAAIDRVCDIQRQQAAESPEVAARGVPPAVAAALCLQPSPGREPSARGRLSRWHRFITSSAGYSAPHTEQTRWET